MPRRILLFGTTGVDKQTAVNNLRAYRQQSLAGTGASSTLVYRDFERDFVATDDRGNFDRLGFYNYLEQPEDIQRNKWEDVWGRFDSDLKNYDDQDVILSLHGVLVRDLYGVRAIPTLGLLQKFKPTHIITLIDDVYMQRWRTKERASNEAYVGEPKLSQLLDARHAEILFGDIIAANLRPRLQNKVLAVRHPARVLHALIFGSDSLMPIYLSFPITGPRELEQQKDFSGIQEVNDFLRDAMWFERRHTHVTFFCPLTIDELPLVRRSTRFTLKDRWDVRAFYGPNELLLTDDHRLPKMEQLDKVEIHQAEGLIRSDVATRDYRMVTQAKALAVFNPWFANKMSDGVNNEIQYAVYQKKPVHIFQDRKHDPGNSARLHYQGTSQPGAMGRRFGWQWIIFHHSLDDMFQHLLSARQ